jgi:hypothetical protein
LYPLRHFEKEIQMEYGIEIKQGIGDTKLDIQCAHQSGILYVVPAEASWVCDIEYIYAHAVAGFFRELVLLEDRKIIELMQRWGIYYRSRPIED